MRLWRCKVPGQKKAGQSSPELASACRPFGRTLRLIQVHRTKRRHMTGGRDKTPFRVLIVDDRLQRAMRRDDAVQAAGCEPVGPFGHALSAQRAAEVYQGRHPAEPGRRHSHKRGHQHPGWTRQSVRPAFPWVRSGRTALRPPRSAPRKVARAGTGAVPVGASRDRGHSISQVNGWWPVRLFALEQRTGRDGGLVWASQDGPAHRT